MNVTVGLAFLAGMASFLSPCVFSLVPAYVSYLSGRSIASTEKDGNAAKARWVSVSHGLAFIVGFSIVFITLGVTVSALGSFLGGFLYDLKIWVARIGGIIIVIFGLHLTGLFRIPFLEYDLRPQSNLDQGRSYISSALMGIFFSAGWSPCVGPVLGAILTLAFNGGSVLQGIKYLSAYSAGLAIPFLAAALGIGWVTLILRRYHKAVRYVEIGMGVILMIVGVMLTLGIYEQLAQYGWFINVGL